VAGRHHSGTLSPAVVLALDEPVDRAT